MARSPRLTKFILESLEGLKETSIEIADIAFSFDGYSKARKHLLQHINPEFERTKNKYRLYALMNHLCKQGLVGKNKKDRRLCWTITDEGRKKLKEINEKNDAFHPKINYQIVNSQLDKEKSFNLIIFDIPEKYKHKRNWLREQLVMLDYSLLQKSVWLGKRKVPQELIKNLDELGLIPCIHIFAVKNEGTISYYQNAEKVK